ncbi:hypothetical protein [Paenibacillus hamazuiensis]|uniref:hypothetical protein n=1 Tax=Paenibacillus hamazuiensis TaxID=2936508 RepID=UPI0020107211|nr:hypothetical protein [Paenibacillus hamazuiensis]
MNVPLSNKAAYYMAVAFYCIGIAASVYMVYQLNMLGVKGLSWIPVLSCIISTIAVLTRMSMFGFIASFVSFPLAGGLFAPQTFLLGVVFLANLFISILLLLGKIGKSQTSS